MVTITDLGKELMEKKSKELWKEVKAYCVQRLEEIRKINADNPCPSAFVCIAAFIGYLSRLAYGTNLRSRTDKKWFEDFVIHFMPRKYHPHVDALYSTFRCGIVHSMSFDDEIDCDRDAFLAKWDKTKRLPSDLAITHHSKYRKYCSGEHLEREPEKNQLVLVADVLCADIATAIGNMFNDDQVQHNSVKFSQC